MNPCPVLTIADGLNLQQHVATQGRVQAISNGSVPGASGYCGQQRAQVIGIMYPG